MNRLAESLKYYNSYHVHRGNIEFTSISTPRAFGGVEIDRIWVDEVEVHVPKSNNEEDNHMQDVLIEKFTVHRNKTKNERFRFRTFTLVPDTDVHARHALREYAQSCAGRFPKLSKALTRWLEDIETAERNAAASGAADAVRDLRKSRKVQ